MKLLKTLTNEQELKLQKHIVDSSYFLDFDEICLDFGAIAAKSILEDATQEQLNESALDCNNKINSDYETFYATQVYVANCLAENNRL